ncbi:DUF488 domain-containing protein [Mesorhizobium sp. BR1-1-3]|uniref:DUF488 domain-containing protein n=1 Tax=Mesorhizobium sp. BR1-1-3 TaxID=2876651 RepID=UPI001CD0D901|nr:DUF488 domain-containing protein [Mesorhizobium sp. BR1-1-3]MBZ9891503.1 DUF488 domain-containing protein [Mesorhizobium sp. BR1-1-3]
MQFYSIGHSTRSFRQFAAILERASIDLIADVRAFPRSRRNPEYNIDILPITLGAYSISYEYFADLGGRRQWQVDVPDCCNALWRNRSFHNYADYALSDAFQDSLDALISRGSTNKLAVMCSEAVWWRCHRRIIADHLISRGHAVCHLMGLGQMSRATLTAGAVVIEHGRVVYPPSESD